MWNHDVVLKCKPVLEKIPPAYPSWDGVCWLPRVWLPKCNPAVLHARSVVPCKEESKRKSWSFSRRKGVSLSPVFSESFCPAFYPGRGDAVPKEDTNPVPVSPWKTSSQCTFSLPIARVWSEGYVHSLPCVGYWNECQNSLHNFASAPCKDFIGILLQAKAEPEVHRPLLVHQSLQPKSPLFVSELADLLAKLGSF